MAPCQGAAAAAAAAAAAEQTAAPPLDGFVIAFSGRFSKHGLSHDFLERRVRSLGGTTMKSIGPDVTHLVCTEQDYDGTSTKVAAATRQNTPLVKLEWLLECSKQRLAVATDGFLWTAGAAAMSKKRPIAASDSGDDDDENRLPTKKPKANGEPETNSDAKNELVAEGQFIIKQGVTVPLDEHCPFLAQVHIDPDTGMIYDASLNQSSTSNNHNKFYRLQILRDADGETFRTWARWGRVGEVGQHAVLGDGSLVDAIKSFEKKFRDKAGLSWDRRGDDPRPGQYAFVERNYNPESGDEYEDTAAESVKAPGQEDVCAPPECTLEQPVQQLMGLIFNPTYFQATMASLNYDANKLPLGKLSKATITRGFQQLKDLAALLDDPSIARTKWRKPFAAAAEQLSNTYYSVIPHAFGRQRPPVIGSNALLKREIELLESLSDMKDATELMKMDRTAVDTMHPCDQQFRSLDMEEMTPLDPSSNEFVLLTMYLSKTRGSSHIINYEVQHVFRIRRRGEPEPVLAGMRSDRRLLWHGSRCTNFGGILSQGLRIAPPEAPVCGYMFGKGIYLADMSSKSANYCVPGLSNGHALLLLCEAELGCPMQELVHANYAAGRDAALSGALSTWGKGSTGPGKWMDAGAVHESLRGVSMPDTSVKPGPTNVQDASLMYNEYICYDVKQVKLRYLFHVTM